MGSMLRAKLWVFKLTSLTQFQIKYAAPPNKFIHYKILKGSHYKNVILPQPKFAVSISGFEILD